MSSSSPENVISSENNTSPYKYVLLIIHSVRCAHCQFFKAQQMESELLDIVKKHGPAEFIEYTHYEVGKIDLEKTITHREEVRAHNRATFIELWENHCRAVSTTPEKLLEHNKKLLGEDYDPYQLDDMVAMPDLSKFHPQIVNMVGWFPTFILCNASWYDHDKDLQCVVFNGRIVDGQIEMDTHEACKIPQATKKNLMGWLEKELTGNDIFK